MRAEKKKRRFVVDSAAVLLSPHHISQRSLSSSLSSVATLLGLLTRYVTRVALVAAMMMRGQRLLMKLHASPRRGSAVRHWSKVGCFARGRRIT